MIGRKSERDELNRMYNSDESEFIAVYGRRRVGKTYLVRETFAGRMTFEHTGLNGGGMARQLRRFYQSLKDYGFMGRGCPRDWDEAFDALKVVVAAGKGGRKVVFIDEMPWMDTQRSNFLSALDAFWNGWAVARKDVVLVVCGSVSSWIVKNLFRNRGGLHNRVTCRIQLMPFTLHECEAYAKERGLALSRMDLLEAYMALGGIPYYWRYLDGRFSLAQNFDRLFFCENAPLREEFEELYASLFKKAKGCMQVARTLASRKMGMTRVEIAEAMGGKVNGALGGLLETLESCGFVRSYRAFGKTKRDAVYQLVDEFTLFHFRFLDVGGPNDPGYWSAMFQSPVHAVWRGLAFERTCLQHIRQIRRALGIAVVHVEAYSWRHVRDDVYPGVQIDLLLERSDNTINICEMRHCGGQYRIDGAIAAELAERVEVFKEVTNTARSVHLTLVTPFGLARNAYSNQVQSVITLDDLFAE